MSTRTGPRTAIVTGANRGIGRALAEAAVASFDHLVTIGRTTPGDLAGRHLQANLAEPRDWPAQLGTFDEIVRAETVVFFDNAAVLGRGGIGAEPFATNLDAVLRVNLSTPVALARALIAIVEARGSDLVLVHLTSGAALRPIPAWGAYCISKAAAAMAYAVIAVEKPHVRVYQVDPGAVDTGMQSDLRAAGDNHAAAVRALLTPRAAAARIFAAIGSV